MAKSDTEITSQDILTLVEIKTKDSRYSYSDIFRTINSMSPNYTKEFWKYFWIPLLFLIASVLGMLFFPQNTSWNRLSIIVFVGASIGAIFVLKSYKMTWWWVLLADAAIVYLVFSESLTMDGIIKLIEKIL